jgi:hypothetical protein
MSLVFFEGVTFYKFISIMKLNVSNRFTDKLVRV